MSDRALSVIVVSAGRAAVLLEKLAALEQQGLAAEELEVVLLDNACPQRVGAQAQARRWPFALQVITSDVRLSAAQARCRAAALARAPLLWLSDDDCVPDPGAAAHHLAHHDTPGRVVIGSVRYVSQARTTLWRPRRVGPLQVTGANTTLERSAFLRSCAAGLRLPRRYGAEDGMVGLQLQQAGAQFVAAPDATVEHRGSDPMHGDDLDKAFSAGYNAVALAQRWPAAAWDLGVHPLQLGLKALAVSSLTERCWPRSARGRVRYERAYLHGARSARADGAHVEEEST